MRSTMQEPCEWKLGGHHVRFEPPDVLWMTFRGGISYEESVWTSKLLQELGSQRPLFIAADLSESTSLDPEGRRYVSEHTIPEWFVGIIYIKARVIHKAAATGISLVQRLLGREPTPLYFVATEEEARHTIARLKGARAPAELHDK
jgi:hypothetical protein